MVFNVKIVKQFITFYAHINIVQVLSIIKTYLAQDDTKILNFKSCKTVYNAK